MEGRYEAASRTYEMFLGFAKELKVPSTVGQQHPPNGAHRESYFVPSDIVMFDYAYLLRAPDAGCSNEDVHQFDSTGRCTVCGSHRRPA
jgi:hypothetical protein